LTSVDVQNEVLLIDDLIILQFEVLGPDAVWLLLEVLVLGVILDVQSELLGILWLDCLAQGIKDEKLVV
jgi:hypothetical protein